MYTSSMFFELSMKTVIDILNDFDIFGVTRIIVLSDNQFSFRKLHNTQTSILNMTETWFRNINQHGMSLSVLLNLKIAFGTVDCAVFFVEVINL